MPKATKGHSQCALCRSKVSPGAHLEGVYAFVYSFLQAERHDGIELTIELFPTHSASVNMKELRLTKPLGNT